MRISYIVGICVEYDAISKSVLDEICWLRETGKHDLKLFSFRCDFSDLPSLIVQRTNDIVFDEHFQSSDLIIYHFGIFTELMDSIFAAPRSANKMIVFHNITPPDLLPDKDLKIIEKSFAQLGHFNFADTLACDSIVNANVLRDHGIAGDHIILPLALPLDLEAPNQKPSSIDGIVRIVYIGRCSGSKGTLELIEVLRRTANGNRNQKFELTLITNEELADPDVLSSAKEFAQEINSQSANLKIELAFSATDTEKKLFLEMADLFCLPSYHEGFCVPVIEALAAGCKVITYDNSNLTFISGGLGHLVPTGDQNAFCAQIDSLVKAIRDETDNTAYESYIKDAQAYVSQFTPEVVRERFLRLIESLNSNRQ